MGVNIIAALDEKSGIGRSNQLLWKIPEDLKHFKELTRGHPVIMGRKTFESIGRVLPDRRNIIISSNPNWQIEGAEVVSALEKAMNVAQAASKDIFIIGGGQIYRQAIDFVDRLYLTIVQGDFDATVFFPDYSLFNKIVFESEWYKSGKYTFKFLELEKNNGSFGA